MSVGKSVGFVVSRSTLDVYTLSFSSVVIGVNCFVFCGKVGEGRTATALSSCGILGDV